MNISVIFTGGTIGSAVGADGKISPAPQNTRELSAFFDAASKNHSFGFFSPVNILSECITTDDIGKIVTAVRKAAVGADAVIITHGTDSLAYSCAALSYALHDIKIPVAVVSSGYVLSDPRANGLRNLSDAITFCKSGIAGVFAVWNGKIHRGTRLCPPRAYTDSAESLSGIHFAEISDKSVILNPTFSALPDSARAFPFPDRNRRILLLSPAPSVGYSGIGDDFDAVLFTSYHSGTTDTKSPSFTDFCKRLTAHGAALFLHGSYPGADYESKSAYEALGITVLPVMSQCAAYMKLFCADFTDMTESLAGDILPEVRL